MSLMSMFLLVLAAFIILIVLSQIKNATYLATLITIIGSVCVVFYVLWSNSQEQKTWESFSQTHACKLIESGIKTGSNSQQDVWLCDDGVKYYLQHQKVR